MAVVISFSAIDRSVFKAKLEKAFEALSIYNYFDAKELFYKSLKKDLAPASYGLSIIFERNDNPFHNLDSAFKYISIADSSYAHLDSVALSEYHDLGASGQNVDSLVIRIDSLFFNLAEQTNEIQTWKKYIANHKSQPFQSRAIENLNALAFKQALDANSSDAYQDFIEKYPEASQRFQAKQELEKAIYREQTKSGLIVDFQRFITNNPKSPYKQNAEKYVYEKFTEDGSLDSYRRFIEDNPQSSFVPKAWKRIYALEIKELTPKSIAAFTLKYPNYPYLDELQNEYDLVTTRYYPVFNGEKWGFIDEYGELKIGYKYDFVEPFKESLALVGIGDSTAYINKSGRYINERFFEDGFSFKRGFAIVMLHEKYGAINRLGEWIIEPHYEDVGDFSGGLFYLDKGKGYGFANQKGEIVLDFEYSDANDFNNDRAVVAIDGKYGIIDTDGIERSVFKYDWIDGFEDPNAPSRFRINEKFGLISRDGLEIDSAIYDQLGEFHEGKAYFAKGEKYGFLNIYGDTVVEPRYTNSTRAFSESFFIDGHAKVFQEKDVAIIDSTGKKVFPAIFQDAGFFQGKLIPIKKRGKWGYADLNVDLAIPYQFNEAQNFKDTLAIVRKDAAYMLIDSLGNNVLDTVYNDLRYIGNLLVASDSLYGIIDRKGNVLVPFTYKSIEEVDTKVAKLNKTNGGINYFSYITQKFIWRQD